MLVAERYAQLWQRLHEMREAWLELRITVREDRPLGQATMLVESLGDDVDDGLAAVEEAVGAVTRALQDSEDLRGGGRALGVVHSRLAQASDHYWRGIASADRQRELSSLARRHGGEWAAWAGSVQDAQGRLPTGISAVNDELRQAWTDLVERATSGSIPSNIGHHASVAGAAAGSGAELRGR
jgi:hypothetical protein